MTPPRPDSDIFIGSHRRSLRRRRVSHDLITAIRGCGVIIAAALIALSPAHSQRESNGLSAYIADERVLVGKYRYEEKGFTIDVSLNADKTALYIIGMGAEEDGFRAEGFWTMREGIIHIHNRPGPVRLEPAGAPARDPTVALFIVARLPNGSPAEGLGVSWPGAGGSFYMSDGRHQTRREEGPVTGEVTISRSSDGKILASFVKRADGPNAYSFTYHPSDVEPFDFSAMALDAKADMLEVEVGTAAAKLRRVR